MAQEIIAFSKRDSICLSNPLKRALVVLDSRVSWIYIVLFQLALRTQRYTAHTPPSLSCLSYEVLSKLGADGSTVDPSIAEG
jgi:hypothetical protein